MKKIKTLLVNNRYEIFFESKTYVIYDTLKAQDIPQYVFILADKIIERKGKIK